MVRILLPEAGPENDVMEFSVGQGVIASCQ